MPNGSTVAVRDPSGTVWNIPRAGIKDALAIPGVELVRQEGLEHSALNPHPKLTKMLSYLPMAGATIGGLAGSELGPGAILTAGAGGGAGELLRESALHRLGVTPTPEPGELAVKTGKEAITQGLTEGIGRAGFAVGGRALNRLRGRGLPSVGEEIGGVEFPETYGQARGKPGGLAQTVEHYGARTFLGGPIKKVTAAQEQSTLKVLANLSGVPDAAPQAMAQNWAKAVQLTRIQGDALYNQIAELPAGSTSAVAQQILVDKSLQLPMKARGLLTDLANESKTSKLIEMPKEGSVKGAHYTDQPTLIPTMRKALDARSELRDLATSTSDRGQAKAYWDAWRKLDTAISRSLPTDQKIIKEQADALWRRSYLQESVQKRLQKMQNVAAPSASPKVAVDSFVNMVNELRTVPLGRELSNVVEYPSKLDILFPNPADRRAMVALSDFLKTKYSTTAGQAGISEGIARVGVALQAVSVPFLAATGREHAAGVAAAHLAGMFGLIKLLANPGGALLLYRYFKAPAAEAGALATRIAFETIKEEREAAKAGAGTQ